MERLARGTGRPGSRAPPAAAHLGGEGGGAVVRLGRSASAGSDPVGRPRPRSPWWTRTGCGDRGGPRPSGSRIRATSSTWLGRSASNSSSDLGSVRRQAQLGEEVGIAGGHQRIEGEEAGRPVIGVEPVPAPRIVAQQRVRPEPADDPGHLPPLVDRVLQFAVDPAQEEHPVVAHRRRFRRPTSTDRPAVDDRRRRPALRLPRRHQGAQVGAGVPTALGPVGEDQVVDPAPGRRPLGQRGAAAELDVVGMGADGQGAEAGVGRSTVTAPGRAGRPPAGRSDLPTAPGSDASLRSPMVDGRARPDR